ncbi:hypothetical protein AG1IA_08471 [Rhizoctonia solani AG-1 IA]|uniref:Uncharacterized protein n=1 Tax=Thanatephorus cucumeris (strain AG1-IA) TaxID=983506 RepID=L8WHS8_THACA|nr:hypothetical protein AG1IA_08471 [Rhizoctonia solani AG-1 IA]
MRVMSLKAGPVPQYYSLLSGRKLTTIAESYTTLITTYVDGQSCREHGNAFCSPNTLNGEMVDTAPTISNHVRIAIYLVILNPVTTALQLKTIIPFRVNGHAKTIQYHSCLAFGYP